MTNPIAQGGDGACRRIGGTVFLSNIRSHVRGVRPSMGAVDELVDAARVEYHIGVGDDEEFGMDLTGFDAKGEATVNDITDLIKLVQKRVKKNSGIDLETEVRIIGKDR